MTSRGPNDAPPEGDRLSAEAERRLVRRLAGEGDGPHRAEIPEASAAERLAALWARLEPPPAAPAPPGFAGRVMARVREEAAERTRRGPGLAVAWARAAGAAALVVGIVVGAGLGRVALAPPVPTPAAPSEGTPEAVGGAVATPASVEELAVAWSESLAADGGLADGYATAIEAIGEGEDER